MAEQEAEHSPVGTRERILEAAEALFAERGFDTVSLRDITGAAEANVAAVNYHFGSKDNLIDAVQERHINPVNEDRLRQLDAAEARHGDDPIPVEEILEAFLAPLLAHIESGRMSEQLFGKFMGRLMGERGYQLPESIRPLFLAVAGRFTDALRKAVPCLTQERALWRMHYSFGALANTLTHGETLKKLSASHAGAPTMEEQFRHIIAFCAAGFQAEEKGVDSDE